MVVLSQQETGEKSRRWAEIPENWQDWEEAAPTGMPSGLWFSERFLFCWTVSSQFRGLSWVPRWVSQSDPRFVLNCQAQVLPTLQWSRRNVMCLHRGHLRDPRHAYQWKPLRPRRTVSLGSTDGQLTMSLCPPVAFIHAHQFTRTLQTHWVIIIHVSGPRERACNATL